MPCVCVLVTAAAKEFWNFGSRYVYHLFRSCFGQRYTSLRLAFTYLHDMRSMINTRRENTSANTCWKRYQQGEYQPMAPVGNVIQNTNRKVPRKYGITAKPENVANCIMYYDYSRWRYFSYRVQCNWLAVLQLYPILIYNFIRICS